MKYLFIAFAFILAVPLYSQEEAGNFQLFSLENIEFTALKPFIHLVRQEYVLVDDLGNVKTRGGNDFYGKVYTIGVLDEEMRLWFPSYIRTPWKIDETYEKPQAKNLKPECSLICIKSYMDSSYFRTKITTTDDKKMLTNMPVGIPGIPYEASTRSSGTLIIFYSSAASPDSFTLISYSLNYLEDIEWNPDGIARIESLHFGNKKIVGGALFTRYLEPGIIRWKLAGFYIPLDEVWVLKSL